MCSSPLCHHGLSIIPTLAILLLLRFYPEWYVIDAFGILVCAGISSLFGVSMTVLPAILLLLVLAVYDAISVYRLITWYLWPRA